MPARPPAPGALAAQRAVEALLQRRDLALYRAARSQLPVAELTAAVREALRAQGTLTPAEERALADHARLIVEAGIRSASRRSRVLSADPRTWGASEAQQVQQALESQRRTLLRSVLDRGVHVEQELVEYLARAQAQGLSAAEVQAHLRQRWAREQASAQRTAEQVVRAGVEQASNARARAAGVEEFVWRAVDRFARPEHRARDGKTYRYSAPPDGELPGEPWGCRCFAQPVIPDDLKEEQRLAKAPLRADQKRDPSGLPLLAEYLPSSLPGGGLEGLLKSMIQL